MVGTHPMARPAPAQRTPFLGFGTFCRKEVLEWRRSKRLWIVLTLTVLAGLIAVLVPLGIRGLALAQGNDLPNVVSPAALTSVLTAIAGGNIFAAFLVVLATAHLMVDERLGGTLAWNLTKPLSRQSLLTAKWLSSTLLLWISLSLVPLLASAPIGIALYGGLPSNILSIVGASLINLASVCFGVLLMLLLGVLLRSQGAIIGIAFAILFAPFFAPLARSPQVTEWLPRLWPTNIEQPFIPLMQGGDVDLLALGVKVAWFIVLAIATMAIFRRQEFL